MRHFELSASIFILWLTRLHTYIWTQTAWLGTASHVQDSLYSLIVQDDYIHVQHKAESKSSQAHAEGAAHWPTRPVLAI